MFTMLRKLLCAGALASLLSTVMPPAAARQKDGKSSQATVQPDKVLYDSAAEDIRKKRFERARLELETLINTYSSSEYLPAAQFAIAESWFKQGGKHGLEQAQEQCRQVMLQFPESPEAKQASDLLRKIEESTREKQAK